LKQRNDPVTGAVSSWNPLSGGAITMTNFGQTLFVGGISRLTTTSKRCANRSAYWPRHVVAGYAVRRLLRADGAGDRSIEQGVFVGGVFTAVADQQRNSLAAVTLPDVMFRDAFE
jgi:hypothetical protein